MKKLNLFIAMLVGFLCGYSVTNFSKLTTLVPPLLIAKKAQLQEMISKVIPELKVEELSVSPIPGIYQVIANNGEIFYAPQEGKYLLHGDLLDLNRTLDNLSQTEDVRKALRLKAVAAITTKEMIIFSPKVVKGVVTVFTDLDCIFCQRLHKEIDKIMELGIEVRYLAFPRQGSDSESYKKTVSVWCSEDTKAMLTAAKNGEDIPKNTCNSPVAKQYELGRKLNLHGTPTLLFPDGFMLASYMPPDKLAEFALAHQTGIK
jgi:thiol:disulfide interchange protein DsbC